MKEIEDLIYNVKSELKENYEEFKSELIYIPSFKKEDEEKENH